METKKKKYYKPGQIVTVDRRVYRLQKGRCVDCPALRLYAISYFGLHFMSAEKKILL